MNIQLNDCGLGYCMVYQGIVKTCRETYCHSLPASDPACPVMFAELPDAATERRHYRPATVFPSATNPEP